MSTAWSSIGVAALVVACGSDKSAPADKPLAVTCTVDRSGAATPSPGLLREGWTLHDRDKSSLRAPKLQCDITGPRSSRATIESPHGDIRIGREGSDHFAISIDKLDPGQKELVVTQGSQRVAVPLSLGPQIRDVKGEPTAAGLLVTGSVVGASEVTIAGKQVPVVGGAFRVEIATTPFLQERLPTLATPLEPVKSLSLLITANTQPTPAYGTVTGPAPAFVVELGKALNEEGTPIPQAALLRFEKDRPTLAVVMEKDGPVLLATKDDIKLSEVELIAHVKLTRLVVEACRYVAEGTPAGVDVTDLPAERVTYAFDVSLTAAKDGREVGTGKVEGKIPPPCPDKLTASTKLDKKLFIGSIPSYADLKQWLRDYVPVKRPK